MTLDPLQGFKDYLPPDAGARSQLRSRWRAIARRAGFTELESPSVERLELFQVKSGEEIAKELFSFPDKGGRPVTLVAETTPQLARAFVERAKAEPLPVKWFTSARLWRYEEPQAGRTREFGQLNLDILGAPPPLPEVELLLTAARILDESGAEGLYDLRVNDRELAEGLGKSLGATDLGAFFRALDRSPKSGREAFERDLAGAGLSPEAIERLEADLATFGSGVPAPEAAAVLDGWLARGLPEPGPAGVARLKRIFELLDRTSLRDRVLLDLRIVRGFAYYTSSVFEAFDKKGEFRALLGGGRYDHLVELFGGPPTPACGLAIGDQTLERVLRANDAWPVGEPPVDTYVVAVTPAEQAVAFEVAETLRAQGISADLDLMGRPLSRQLKEAHRRQARRAILVGAKELARGTLLERDLTTGEQREILRSAPDGRGAHGVPPAPA